MRITHHSLVDQVIANVQDRMERIAQRQNEVSTGVRVNKASVDPIAAGEIIELQGRIDRLQQYLRNIEHGQAQMRASESALQEVSDLLVKARAAAIEGANGTLKEADRKTLAVQVEGIIGNLMEIANSRHGKHYLFGGTETSQEPYTAVTNSDGVITSITKNFTSQNDIELIFDEGKRETVNITAEEAFDFGGGESAFSMLLDLRDALDANDPDAVGNVITRLDNAMDQIADLNALVGARVNSSRDHYGFLEVNDIDMTTRMAELSDVDIVDAITRLDEEKTSYELGLRTAAKVIQPSLVNFVYL